MGGKCRIFFWQKQINFLYVCIYATITQYTRRHRNISWMECKQIMIEPVYMAFHFYFLQRYLSIHIHPKNVGFVGNVYQFYQIKQIFRILFSAYICLFNWSASFKIFSFAHTHTLDMCVFFKCFSCGIDRDPPFMLCIICCTPIHHIQCVPKNNITSDGRGRGHGSGLTYIYALMMYLENISCSSHCICRRCKTDEPVC